MPQPLITVRRLPFSMGKYELIEHIGDGGMGDVYLARRLGVAGFEKRVVIKLIRPHLAGNETVVHMFVREAKIAAQVAHRNVVQVFELEELESGELYMAMEYIAGLDLRRVLQHANRRNLRLPVWFAVHVIAEVLEGLIYVHTLRDLDGTLRNIVHRDISPANVFVSHQGEVKLSDFGVAKDITMSARETHAGILKGKVAYMPPEQIEGKTIDGRVDVFSAGVVLWELLAMRRLFGGRNEFHAMMQICKGVRPSVIQYNPAVPEQLDAVILRAIEADRERRYATAKDFQTALFDVLSMLRPRVRGSDVSDVLEIVLGRADPGEMFDASLAPVEEAAASSSFTLSSLDLPTMEGSIDSEDVIGTLPVEAFLGPAPSPAPEPHALVDDLVVPPAPRGTTLPPYLGFHPMWVRGVRDGRAQVIGPRSWQQMEELVLRIRGAPGEVSLSADNQSWLSLELFAELSGQELLIPEHRDRAMRALTDPNAREGELDALGPRVVLARLAREEATGVVTFAAKTGALYGHVHLLAGAPTYVDVNLPPLQIPAWLLKNQLLPKELIPGLLHGVLALRRPILELAQERNLYEGTGHYSAVMKQRLAALLVLNGGRFSFDPRATPHGVPFAPVQQVQGL